MCSHKNCQKQFLQNNFHLLIQKCVKLALFSFLFASTYYMYIWLCSFVGVAEQKVTAQKTHLLHLSIINTQEYFPAFLWSIATHQCTTKISILYEAGVALQIVIETRTLRQDFVQNMQALPKAQGTQGAESLYFIGFYKPINESRFFYLVKKD